MHAYYYKHMQYRKLPCFRGKAPSKTFQNKASPIFFSMQVISRPLPGRRDGLRSVPWLPLGSPPSRSARGGEAWAGLRSAARRSQTGWREATRGVGATGRANWAERDQISWNLSALYFPKPWAVCPPRTPLGCSCWHIREFVINFSDRMLSCSCLITNLDGIQDKHSNFCGSISWQKHDTSMILNRDICSSCIISKIPPLLPNFDECLEFWTWVVYIEKLPPFAITCQLCKLVTLYDFHN